MKTVALYRTKPLIIEAVEWTGNNLGEIWSFVGDSMLCEIYDAGLAPRGVNVIIHTLEGALDCREGDYIIKGIKGEFYPCKPDVFAKTYELVGGEDKNG